MRIIAVLLAGANAKDCGTCRMSLLLGTSDRRNSKAAAAAARAAGRPCLEWLPDELWVQVFEHLQWPGDLHRLALVSRATYSIVLPNLYRTVVVGWAAPDQMHSMLCLLARDEVLAGCVRTLVVDDDASKYGRPPVCPDDIRQRFLLEEALIDARKRLDEKALDRARTVLYRVLPTLTNLREVVLARTHPVLFSAGAWVKQAPPPKLSRIAKLLTPMRRPQRNSLTEEVFHRGSGTDLWSTFRRRDKTTPQIVRLVAPLVVFRAPQYRSTMATLTSLTLHHIRMVPDDKACLKRWNRALRNAKSLRKLALLDISSGSTLLTGCSFPCLEQFEACGLPSRSTERNRTLSIFLLDHAETLQIIALQVNPARASSPFWDGPWLRQPESFLSLHTLRLDVTPRVHAMGWYAEGCPDLGAEHLFCWRHIFNFVQECTGITDLALSGAPLAAAQKLRFDLKSKRIMSRALVGSKLLQSFETFVGPNCVYGIPWKRAVYRYRFALQHWMFCDVLFHGLELSVSGHFPSPRREIS